MNDRIAGDGLGNELECDEEEEEEERRSEVGMTGQDSVFVIDWNDMKGAREDIRVRWQRIKNGMSLGADMLRPQPQRGGSGLLTT